MISKLSFVTVCLAGCTINGKGYGPGSSTPASPSASPSQSTASAASSPGPAASNEESLGAGFEATEQGPPDGHYAKLPPYPSAPADPWVGVAGDQPVRWPTPDWIVRPTPGTCTAAQDHCLVKEAWFVVKESERRRTAYAGAYVIVFDPKGKMMAPGNARGGGTGDDFIAYRTVPATRANFVPGATVVGLIRPHPHPADGRDAVEMGWSYGVVEEVDLELGVYKLKGHTDTLMLSGARTAVLSWKPGTAVQILGGKRRDQLAVNPRDVFLPEP